jgi:hypothetical protein
MKKQMVLAAVVAAFAVASGAAVASERASKSDA